MESTLTPYGAVGVGCLELGLKPLESHYDGRSRSARREIVELIPTSVQRTSVEKLGDTWCV